MTIRTLTMLAAAAVLVSRAAPIAARQTAAAPGAGTVSGTFTVAGKIAKITHVYATSSPGFFGKKKIDTTVTLSDVELTPKQLAHEFGLMQLADAGKAHGLILVIDDAKQIISCQMHDPAFKMSASVAGTNLKFDATTFSKTRIAGKAYLEKPDTFGPHDVPYDFSVTFDTPVRATGK
jgi:hypothetical protein